VYLYNTTTGNFSYLGEFFGRNKDDTAGRSVAAGDFNGDGYADFVLGTPGASDECLNASATYICGAGVLYVYNVSSGNFSYGGEFFGSDYNDQAGYSIAAGDFNNDGADDFVLGAINARGKCVNAGVNDQCGSGVVYLANNVANLNLLSHGIANNASALLFRITTAKSVSAATTQFYRFYLGTGSAGSSLSPESVALPFSYNRLVQVNGSVCRVLDSAGADLGMCSLAANGGDLEVAAPLSLASLSLGQAVNVTFETAAFGGRVDLAPDLASYLSYTAPGLGVSSPVVNESYPRNGTRINISATVTPVGVTVDKVWANSYYPNGSLVQSIRLVTGGGSTYFNDTFIVPSSPLGNYSVQVVANDTGGTQYSSTLTQFAPYLSLSQSASITVDGDPAEWVTLANISDPVDAASSPTLLNAWLSKAPAYVPLARQAASMTFDPNLNATILFGGDGASACDGSGSSRCDGTYLFNATTGSWQSLGAASPPSGRYDAMMVFDTTLNATVLFGGHGPTNCDGTSGGSINCNGTYLYNASENRWRSLTVASPPSARWAGSMVFDPNLNATVLFGGNDNSGACDSSGGNECNGTYMLNVSGMKWQRLAATAPPARRMDAMMVFDRNMNATVLFGGYGAINCDGNSGGASAYCNGTWMLNVSGMKWQSVGAATPPSGRTQAVMVFDENLNATLLFGGSTYYLDTCDGASGGTCNGTYLFNATGKKWQVLNISNPPKNLASASAVFDKNLNGTLLFGGSDSMGNYLNSTEVYYWIGALPVSDLISVSIANSASYLFVRMQANARFDLSPDRYYRVYVGSGSSGSSLSPEGSALPFAYQYRTQVNGSVCAVYTAAGTSVGSCSFAGNSNTLEISVPLSTIGVSLGQPLNVTFEAASSYNRSDIAPDLMSYLSYTSPGAGVSNVAVNDSRPRNGTSINISATVTPVGVTIDKVWANIYYLNGSLAQSIRLVNGGSTYYNDTFVVPSSPLGNYSVQAVANDTTGTQYSSSSVQFAPYLALSQSANIGIDGAFGDWGVLFNITDPSDVTFIPMPSWAAEPSSAILKGREKMAMVFDPNLNATLLFGGESNGGNCDGSGINYCNGTYLYNLSARQWQSLGAATPPMARSGAAMVFDPNLNATLLFGGKNVSGRCDGSGTNYCNGTYFYNVSGNRWQSIALAALPPVARSDMAMVFDPVLNATLLFGGYSGGSCDGSSTCNGTYLYNVSGKKWQIVAAATPPLGRLGHKMVFDKNLNATILFGGFNSAAFCDGSGINNCNGTYLFNVSGNKWQSVLATVAPPARGYMGMVFDEDLNGTIIYGGFTGTAGCDGSTNGYCNGTYLYNISAS
jgi:hypothetical protein